MQNDTSYMLLVSGGWGAFDMAVPGAPLSNNLSIVCLCVCINEG